MKEKKENTIELLWRAGEALNKRSVAEVVAVYALINEDYKESTEKTMLLETLGAMIDICEVVNIPESKAK